MMMHLHQDIDQVPPPLSHIMYVINECFVNFVSCHINVTMEFEGLRKQNFPIGSLIKNFVDNMGLQAMLYS